FLGEVLDLGPQVLDRAEFTLDKLLPAALRQLGYHLGPVRVKLGALVGAQEVFTANAVLVSQTQQLAFVLNKALVDVVELLDQRFDTLIVERQRLHGFDQLVLELLGAELLGGRQVVVAIGKTALYLLIL